MFCPKTDFGTILLGTGTGSFGAKTDFGTGSSPFSVAVGDFNGDGKLDLAVANFSSNTVSILLGTGTGSFGAKTDFGTGSAPRSVAVGDFNGDGKLDLAVANGDSNTVSILLGTGTGSFGTKTDFGTGSSPFSVAVGDFNGDGKLDLAVANLLSDTSVSILLNNTPPSITAAPVTRTAGNPSANSQIATVDDAQDAPNTLSVTVNGGTSATVNGVTVTLNPTAPNASGQVFADVVAACAATTANFTLRVTDSCGLFTEATLTVTVTANTAPTLTYSTASVANGGSTTINPATGPSDNGSVASIVLQSQGTYTGTISVDNVTGVVSISNAAPIGSHTITIRATDNCGTTTDATFTLNVTNNAPAITAGAPVTRQQGSAGTTATIATVSDPDQSAGSLTVTATTVPSGISVTGITNTSGTVTATVAANCSATVGANTVVLTVTDSNSGTATANFTVNVTANTAPTLTYNTASVANGGSTSINPATGPSDNGSVASIVVQSQGTYTGTISVDNVTGVVSISNAGPIGSHTITIRATDNCGLTTDANFTLNVTNNAPAITAGAAATRQQGSAGTTATIATVSDPDQSAGSLTVTATTVPSGISVTGITNNSGTVTATVAADCTATVGANTVVLTVTDSNSGSSTADYTVNVTANTAPSLTYNTASVTNGGSTSINPASGPSDNGSVASVVLQSQGTYTGTISVDNTAGVVSISNAAPMGSHAITIRATDNCGLETDAAFTLKVNETPESGPDFVVNKIDDHDDGVCGPTDCTLREAINAANANADASIITFAPALSGQTINLAGALPNLATDLTITGPGVDQLTVRRDTGGDYSVFKITAPSVDPTVHLSGLTITNGKAETGPNNSGGGIAHFRGTLSVADCVISGNSAQVGGGFFSQVDGVIRFTRCRVEGNSASSVAGGLYLFGGSQTVYLTDSSVTGNMSAQEGAGIYLNNATLIATNCTISGNTTSTIGGGMYSSGFSTLTGVTVTNNRATTSGGGIYHTAGRTLMLRDTIAAGNFKGTGSTAADADDLANNNPQSASSHNLIGTGGGNLAGTNGNQTGVTNPGLGPLADNGGPTLTHALLPGSPAIDAGISFTTLTTLDGSQTSFDVQDATAFPTGVGFTIRVDDEQMIVVSKTGNTLTVTRGANGTAAVAHPAGSAVTPAFDQRGPGFVRTFDNLLTANATGGDGTDIGAFEVQDTPPTITGATISRSRGDNNSNLQIATVSDNEAPPTALTVTVNGGTSATVNGVTVSNIAVDGSGNVTADVAADCTASNASFTLRVTDSGGLYAEDTLTVNVTANTAPTLTYNAASVANGGSTTINPANGPSDNGSIASVVVQSKGTYTGTISVDNTTGVVSISNAAPIGSHTITIRATDNCGLPTDANFTLNVTNHNRPSIGCSGLQTAGVTRARPPRSRR